MDTHNQQHTKIVSKIIQKYGHPKTPKLKEWLKKYSELSTEEINSVVAKFQSFVGYDEEREWGEEEIHVFILVGVAAQKGKNMMELREGNLGKYKKHSFVIGKKGGGKGKEGEKGKEEGKEKGIEKSNSLQESKKIQQKVQCVQSVELKQSINVSSKISKEPITTPTQDIKQQTPKTQTKKLIESSYEQILLSQNPQPEQPPRSPSPTPPLSPPPDSFKKKRSSLHPDPPIKSPPPPPSPSLNPISPPRSKHFSNQLQQSISTKMPPFTLNPAPSPLPQQLPSIKPLQPSHSFFESRIEIQNHSLHHNKPLKHLQIQINKFHKFSQGWSTVIKYEIVTPDESHANLLRRYSEFSKLHSYLSQNYPGVIIPELPPKEYLKGAIWSADNAFLNNRRIGLQLFLNKILAHDILGQDHLVLRFIDDQKLDDESYGNTSYIQTADKYLKTLLSITKNTGQIKDYGVAYYSYMKSSVINELPQEINDLYEQIKMYLQKFNKFKEFVEKMENIYISRGIVQREFLDIGEKKGGDEKYKKQLNQVGQEFSEAKTAYDGYCKLKAETKWYELLYETKKGKEMLTKEDEELKVQFEEAEKKVMKVTPMLEKEMREFIRIKGEQLKGLLENFVAWKVMKESM